MTHTPNTWRPAGASDHKGWEVVWAYALARVSLTANRSPENIVAEQKAVWAVNEMLAGTPSSDAAEGAVECAGLLREWAKAYRDSPEHRFPSDPHAEFFPVDLEGAANLLSAPPKLAPSPDGAGETRLITAEDRQYASELLADLTSDDLPRLEIAARWFRKARVERAIASPTGAVEPDDDWEARSERSYIDNATAGRFAKLSNDEAAHIPEGTALHVSSKTTRELIGERIAGAAEPDAVREALAERMARHAKAFKDHTGTVELTVSIKEIQTIAYALSAPAVHGEKHTARFLARLVYRRGVAYGKGLESEDAWVDANWRFFLGDARRLGGIAPAVGVTREVLNKLLLSAKLLQQNSEACAANHYGSDFETFGLPGWLADTKKDIEAAEASLSPVPVATVSAYCPITIYRVEDDHDNLWVRVPGADIASVKMNSKIGRALLVLEADLRARSSSPQDVGREATVERCAKIAEPWPGFWLDESSTDAERAVVAIRTEIAKTIRALSGSEQC